MAGSDRKIVRTDYLSLFLVRRLYNPAAATPPAIRAIVDGSGTVATGCVVTASARLGTAAIISRINLYILSSSLSYIRLVCRVTYLSCKSCARQGNKYDYQ